MEQKICCVILAAGSSKRMGEEKALVRLNGESLISWISKRLVKIGLNPVIVTKKEIFDSVKSDVYPNKVILNRSPELGRTGSIKVGINYLDEHCRGDYRLIIVPVDRPGFSDETLLTLTYLHETSCPQKNNIGGHPIILSPSDVDIVRNSDSGKSLRDLVDTKRFEVRDENIHLNLDTKKDLEEFRKVFTSLG